MMSEEFSYSVRVRASVPDKYAGLKGLDYIRARGLSPRPNHSVTNCEHCALMEYLPAVLNILASVESERAQ
jgi:hypothetical protein